LALGLLVCPAFAELDTVGDPEGDIPDILRFTIDNRENAVVTRMKYADIEKVEFESFYIKWGSRTYYRVRYFEGDSSHRLFLYQGDESTKIACSDMVSSRDADSGISNVRVPRKCLKKAPDRVRARGVATKTNAYWVKSDGTAFTEYVARD
jgi:hypothetical protein